MLELRFQSYEKYLQSKINMQTRSGFQVSLQAVAQPAVPDQLHSPRPGNTTTGRCSQTLPPPSQFQLSSPAPQTPRMLNRAPTVTNTTVLCPQHFPLILPPGREHCASLHAQIVHSLLLSAPFPHPHHPPSGPKTRSQARYSIPTTTGQFSHDLEGGASP